MTLRQDYKQWLSLGFLRSESFIATATKKLTFGDFDSSERAFMAIFKIASDWNTAYNTPVPFNHVESVIENDIVPNRVLNDNELSELVDLLQYAYDDAQPPIDHIEGYLNDTLTEYLEERKVRPILQKAATSNNLSKIISELSVAVTNAQTKAAKAFSIRPFAFDQPVTSPDKKTPWGCDFIDAIIGGSVIGETTLFLAPSGGGKTLSNIQIACASAMAGERSVIFSYEQSAVPGLTNRIYSYVLGKPVAYFQGVTEEDMKSKLATDKHLKARWEDVREVLHDKLEVFDMLTTKRNKQGADGGAKEIKEQIQKLQDAGWNPRYVGLDWFGPFIDNYMHSSDFAKKRASAPKHEIMSAAANELRLIGEELKINLFIYHQLGTAAATKRPMDLPMATDAFESRTLHHYMDTVICVGNRTPVNNLAFVTVPKHRNGEPHHKACIEMDGAHSRWIYRGDKVVDDGNGGLMIPGMGGGSDDEEVTTSSRPNLIAVSSLSTLGFVE